MDDDENLAYGDLPGKRREGESSFMEDALRKVTEIEGVASIFNGIQSRVNELRSEIGAHFPSVKSDPLYSQHSRTKFAPSYRYESFAREREGNAVKWYIDGCAYMWAVSIAIEEAKKSIWILDWWLSPELYLRRPPSKNERYRLDRMLQAAAQRGVKVKVIVYKEVEQALTRKYLSPVLTKYLHHFLPQSLDPLSSAVGMFGVAATFEFLEHLEREYPLISPPIPVSSVHTKHALEALSPNISVFRHPDHLPDAQTLESSFTSSLQRAPITAETATELPSEALKALYGVSDDVILFWAHHEKLCLIDGHTAFMGGLDLCYGRWDTYQHSIADCHPGNMDDVVWPGQDFNNARIMDFVDVSNWRNNKLNRTESSRMGWSDVSVGLQGPVIEDLKFHFIHRWNFIYSEKYDVHKDTRYSKLHLDDNSANPSLSAFPDRSRESQGTFDNPNLQSGSEWGGLNMNKMKEKGEILRERLEDQVHDMRDKHFRERAQSEKQEDFGSINCQIVRSCTKWSNGTETESSIAKAYIGIIQDSQHFVYIENQFFITATSDKQGPIQNRIGAAIVERILRAARVGEKYKIIVVIPAVPAFSGDLKDDSSLGTRAIMEYQYNSISRGGHSIMENIAKAGFDPSQYIRFYNLRNYDRINVGPAKEQVELNSGIDYEAARRQHDDIVDPVGHRAQERDSAIKDTLEHVDFEKYQDASKLLSPDGQYHRRWDSVAACYMLGGPDIRDIPWEDGEMSEMDAFVSEELYIHSKLLIADDRIVICGSANLNDRSQLGYHDSEIAIIVEDQEEVDSYMNERPWRASKFATTLRRQLFRKHLGLLQPQDMAHADQNFNSISNPNLYDFGSEEDRTVVDPLSEEFLGFWNRRARQNTDAFGRIFHPIPHDNVRTWAEYKTFFERFFLDANIEAEGKEGTKKPAKYKWGHVVGESFPPGPSGIKEMKDLLSTMKGTLVEMPLSFLIDEDIAKEGLSLNSLTEEIYT